MPSKLKASFSGSCQVLCIIFTLFLKHLYFKTASRNVTQASKEYSCYFCLRSSDSRLCHSSTSCFVLKPLTLHSSSTQAASRNNRTNKCAPLSNVCRWRIENLFWNWFLMLICFRLTLLNYFRINPSFKGFRDLISSLWIPFIKLAWYQER